MKAMIGKGMLAAALALGLAVLPACKTDTAGVKSNYRQQYTTVDATAPEATEAAKEVLESLGLKDVKATSTKLDGMATAKTADGTDVTVSVKRVTGSSSELTVVVGTLGDPQLGKTIVSKIRENLGMAM